MAITAVLMIAAVIDGNVGLYEPICCFPCWGVYLRQPQRPRRLPMSSDPASPPWWTVPNLCSKVVTGTETLKLRGATCSSLRLPQLFQNVYPRQFHPPPNNVHTLSCFCSLWPQKSVPVLFSVRLFSFVR
uniref:Secreted protein n=1 Tax=Myotis myotis TaxID=51298 RepID=A0A7J7R7N1_MYOMY|nr:hypothetical protein mMyoMyo1_010887 [Myotis myotis]